MSRKRWQTITLDKSTVNHNGPYRPGQGQKCSGALFPTCHKIQAVATYKPWRNATRFEGLLSCLAWGHQHSRQKYISGPPAGDCHSVGGCARIIAFPSGCSGMPLPIRKSPSCLGGGGHACQNRGTRARNTPAWSFPLYIRDLYSLHASAIHLKPLFPIVGLPPVLFSYITDISVSLPLK